MNLLFDVYDNTGGNSVNTESIILYNTIRYLKENVSLSSGEIVIKFSNSHITPPNEYVLLLNAKITTNIQSGNDRSQCKAWLEADYGNGYEIIPGTNSYSYNRNSAAGFGSILLNSTFVKNKDSISIVKFRVKALKIIGSSSIETVANASNFIGLIDL